MICTKFLISALLIPEAELFLTNHIALVVLAAALISDMCLDSEPYHGEVFDAKICRIDATDDTKPATIIDCLSDILKLGPKSGQREVFAVDEIAI